MKARPNRRPRQAQSEAAPARSAPSDMAGAAVRNAGSCRAGGRLAGRYPDHQDTRRSAARRGAGGAGGAPPPQPLPAWTGSRDALQFGPECMQGAGRAPVPMSEDCLFLNLWVAAKPATGHLPVLVWVHGGAFKVGSAGQPVYDGASLARQGLVVVTLNYRLGKFGFLAHPALTRENPDGPLGNYGLMDVLAVLKWVQANIKAFSGDPRQVTLAGQSAGGAAVYDLLTSPLADGLFSKAIVESGVFSTPTTPFEKAEQAGAAAAASWD